MHEEPSEEYHSKRGLYMTSHRMIAARKSTAEFIEDTRNQKSDTDAYYFGRAAHVYSLEGKERFDQEYVVGGPVNPKTNKCYGSKTKRFAEWAKDQPLPAVTNEEHQLIERMDRSIKANNAARQLLDKGRAELTGRCHIAGVPCQVRTDWITKCNRIVDLKTTSDIARISIDCELYGYPIQQAFYQQCVEIITGVKMPCYLIWIEKSESATCVVWKLDDERLESEAQQNIQKIEEVKEVFFSLIEKEKTA